MEDCKRERRLSDPLDPPSEETMKWACDVLGHYLKTMRELNRKSKLPIEVTEEHIKIINRLMEEKKTKKMTKAEAFEYLKGKKVKCYERSNALYCELVEKITTECGCIYNGFMNPPDVSVFAIHIDDAGYIRHLCTVDADKYNELKYEELSADDILSIEIVEEKQCSEEDALDLISTVGARLSEVLRRMEGHKHIVITEDDAILYDEGMCLFHSDPF